MKVAAVHNTSHLGDWDFNLKETEFWLNKMEEQHADFVLFPELNLSGYSSNPNSFDDLQVKSKQALSKVLQLSAGLKTAFAVGCPEKIGDRFYISHFLFQAGKLIGKHRKTHLGSTEAVHYSASGCIDVFPVNEVKVGMQLCFESHFPELSYKQAFDGASLLAFAFASPRETPTEKLQRLMRYLPARAYDNACFAVACNTTGTSVSGKDMAGVALIVNPKGELLAHSSSYKGGYCIADCDFNEVSRIQSSRMAWFNASKNRKWIQHFYTENKQQTDKINSPKTYGNH